MTWIDFALEEAVKARSSVRNYADREIEPEKMEKIRRFVEALDNPFHQEVSFHWLQEDALPAGQKLGTYGVIKGAKRFIGASVRPGPLAMEALGYEMETLILYLAHLGLGSCWLGGTFNRKGFAKAMEIGEDHLFPAITPFGYGAPTRHVTEKLMRSMIQADRRSPWESLFSRDDFSSPLSREEAGDLAFPLDMLRLGPSASNKQPWRVLLRDNALHFYEDKAPGYSDAFAFDIQRIDMGIAAAHADLALRERGISGRFDPDVRPDVRLPERLVYAFSWLRDEKY